MADISALYPQPPQNQQNQNLLIQNPLNLLSTVSGLQTQALQREQLNLSINQSIFTGVAQGFGAMPSDATPEDVNNRAANLMKVYGPRAAPMVQYWKDRALGTGPNNIARGLSEAAVAGNPSGTTEPALGPPDPNTLQQRPTTKAGLTYLAAPDQRPAQPAIAPPQAIPSPNAQPIDTTNTWGMRSPAVPGATPVTTTRILPPNMTLRPGQAESVAAQAAEGQKMATELQRAGNEVPNQLTQLDLMLNDLQQAKSKFGPTAGYEKVANVIANRVLGFHPTMSKEEIGALESFDKVAKQIAQSQAGQLHATDAYLNNSLGANPNSNLSGYGAEGIINMLKGNADAVRVKYNEWNKALASGRYAPDQAFQFSNDFNSKFDPRVFQFMRMNHDQQSKLLSNIDDKAQFERNLFDANQRGWITLPKKKKNQ